MPRSWLIDCRGLAKKVKNASLPAAYQIKDCGANRECPNCHHHIDNRDISQEWPGLPAGIKFDPSDAELLEHLAAKCGVGNSEPHMFIDEFIPTLEGDEGICCTHPENLPGAKKDGSSIHFFYRTMNAYATGQRKRRKIQMENSLTKVQVRWHKTGKTKPVMENGTQKGCKKIMVLYKTSKRGSKPDKSNWVMHQYHLGSNEDEKEGAYVVSKISYQQQKQSDNDDTSVAVEESDIGSLRTSPRTPRTITPIPPRPGGTLSCDDVADDNVNQSLIQEEKFLKEGSNPSSSDAQSKDRMEFTTWWAGESQAVDVDIVDELLLCNEIIDSTLSSGFRLGSGPSTSFPRTATDMPLGVGSSSCGIAELENLELDTPPDFQLDMRNSSKELEMLTNRTLEEL